MVAIIWFTPRLCHSLTISLEAEGEILFIFEQRVVKGSGGLPGSVWARPDARLLEFRLYYEVGGNLFSDGYLHQTEVQADAAVSMDLAIAA